MQGAIASKACKLEEQKDKGRTKELLYPYRYIENINREITK